MTVRSLYLHNTSSCCRSPNSLKEGDALSALSYTSMSSPTLSMFASSQPLPAKYFLVTQTHLLAGQKPYTPRACKHLSSTIRFSITCPSSNTFFASAPTRSSLKIFGYERLGYFPRNCHTTAIERVLLAAWQSFRYFMRSVHVVHSILTVTIKICGRFTSKASLAFYRRLVNTFTRRTVHTKEGPPINEWYKLRQLVTDRMHTKHLSHQQHLHQTKVRIKPHQVIRELCSYLRSWWRWAGVPVNWEGILAGLRSLLCYNPTTYVRVFALLARP